MVSIIYWRACSNWQHHHTVPWCLGKCTPWYCREGSPLIVKTQIQEEQCRFFPGLWPPLYSCWSVGRGYENLLNRSVCVVDLKKTYNGVPWETNGDYLGKHLVFLYLHKMRASPHSQHKVKHLINRCWIPLRLPLVSNPVGDISDRIWRHSWGEERFWFAKLIIDSLLFADYSMLMYCLFRSLSFSSLHLIVKWQLEENQFLQVWELARNIVGSPRRSWKASLEKSSGIPRSDCSHCEQTPDKQNNKYSMYRWVWALLDFGRCP